MSEIRKTEADGPEVDLMPGGHRFVSPDIHYSELEDAEPRGILAWAAETIDRLAVATSFQSSGLVILHLLKGIRSDVPVLFLDTGFHYAETLEFRDHIA